VQVTSTLAKYLRAMLEPTRIEPITGLHFKGKNLSQPSNIRLGRRCMIVINTLLGNNYGCKKFYSAGPWFQISLGKPT